MREEIDVAFDAMLAFLENYWIRGGRRSEDLAILLGSASRGPDNFPMDPALWDDWERVYKAAAEAR